MPTRREVLHFRLPASDSHGGAAAPTPALPAATDDRHEHRFTETRRAGGAAGRAGLSARP